MLPIESAIPELLDALAGHPAVVLEAPPGAGKTTRVPLALLDAPWLGNQRIVMLEPRRLAARAAAHRMANTLGQRVGDQVGYRVRGDTRVGPRTRIEVVTEGVLTRMLQHDAALDGVGMVIFDEFHERSLTADTGLALTLATVELLRPDLRILVMSATIDGDAVAALLGNAPIVRSAGRSFPVDIRHAPSPSGVRSAEQVARVVANALAQETGSILAFLDGTATIRRTHDLLRALVPRDVTVHSLTGAMSADEQDRAIAAAAHGARKVVLATNVAESSLTIEGIRIVVDSGWVRIPRYSPRTGMTRLDTVRVSRASADQRCGRAGRVMPGICIRCWSAVEDSGLMAHARAEILDADLMPLALDLAAAGHPDPTLLRWLDAPSAAAFNEARALLTLLGAFDARGRITEHGTAMAQLGTHPRLAHMLLRARSDSDASGVRAAALAALLDERDPLRSDGGPPEADITLRLDVVEQPRRGHDDARLDGALLSRVRAAATDWRQRLGTKPGDMDDALDPGTLLALAYPDRVAQRRGGVGRFLLRNGRGASLPVHDPLAQAEWIVAAALDDTGVDARIQLGAAFDPAQLERLAGEQITTTESVEWDEGRRAVRAVRRTTLGALVLSEVALGQPDPAQVRSALLDALRRRGAEALPWDERSERLRDRMRFVAMHADDWPSVGSADLLDTLDSWLGPSLGGVRNLDGLSAVDLSAALLARLTWQQRQQLDDLAPERVAVPSGSEIRVDYHDPHAPALAVRLQEVFGLRETPRVAGGKVPLVLHLLSPGYRPAQVTRDLRSFWETGYFDVRKELRGRYPKHAWPDDPASAVPVRGPRRRR